MASIIKSNTYADFNGREILTADSDGNLTTQKTNYPMFLVELSSNQTISNNTYTKVQFDSTTFDTGSYWDSTNYRYTPLVAGKYFFYADVFNVSSASTTLIYSECGLSKNGAQGS